MTRADYRAGFNAMLASTALGEGVTDGDSIMESDAGIACRARVRASAVRIRQHTLVDSACLHYSLELRSPPKYPHSTMRMLQYATQAVWRMHGEVPSTCVPP
jgi:hypothetical protein